MILTIKSPKSKQKQLNTNIKLFPHQLASVYQMLIREQQRNITLNNYTYNLNYGILSNDTGSGKSYIILELCNYNINNVKLFDNLPLSINNLYIGNTQLNSVINYLHINIIIVPHFIFHQWKQYSKTYNSDSFFIGTKKELSSYFNIINNYFEFNNFHLNYLFNETTLTNLPQINKIVIIKNTMIGELQHFLNINNIIIDRLFIDEFIHITSITSLIKANFTWFISCTINNINNQLINDILFLPDIVLNKIIINIHESFLNLSLQLPKINIINKLYRLSSYNNILTNITNFLSKNDNINSLNELSTIFNINIDNSKHIIYSILNKWENELLSYNDNSLPDITHRNILIQKIENLNNKIKEYECVICYNTNENYIFTTCCNSICCSDCIFKWIKEKKHTCVICRTSLDKTFDAYINLKDIPIGQNTVIINIINNILDKNTNAKILICSKYVNSFSYLIDFCKHNLIKHDILHGTERKINIIINEYNKGNINILFLTDNNGIGNNLESTTDLIIFDFINKEIKQQIIGRCQRFGRTTSLNVYNIIKQV